MQDLGSYGIVAQCFEFLATLGDERHRARPGRVVGAERGRQRLDVPTASGRHVAGRHRLHVGRRRRHARPPRRRRQRRAEGRHRPRLGRRDRSGSGRGHAARAERQLPVPRVGLQRAVRHHAGRVRRPARRSTPSPNGTGAWVLKSFDAATGAEFERNPDWWGGTTPLDGSVWSFFDDEGSMVTAASAGEVDTLVQFQVIGGDALFNDENFTVVGFRAATHRQIWMRCDQGQFADARVRRALGMCIDRQALDRHPVQGQGRHRQRPRDRPDVPVLRPVGSPARARHRRCQGAARRSRVPRRPAARCCTSASCRRSPISPS